MKMWIKLNDEFVYHYLFVVVVFCRRLSAILDLGFLGFLVQPCIFQCSGIVRVLSGGWVFCRMGGFSHGSPVVGWFWGFVSLVGGLCAWSAFILQCQQWLLFCSLNVVRHSSGRPMTCQHLIDFEPFEIFWINRCWQGFLGWLITGRHYTSRGAGRGDLCFVKS